MRQTNEPVVVVRRVFDRDAYGIWLGVARDDGTHFAKPLKLEIAETIEGWALPEPTLIIPGLQAKEWLSQFSEQMSFNGVSIANARETIEAKNENLKDLRRVIDNLFTTVSKQEIE